MFEQRENYSEKIPGPTIEQVGEALQKLQVVVKKTPLELHEGYSERFEANIWLKREDLQRVRSYKIRGAYNKISSLPPDALQNGIVCASAGNHAQGFALSCAHLGIKGTIYMPTTTPQQKITKVKKFGKEWVTVVLYGDSFDDANQAAQDFCNTEGASFIPPFNDEKVIEGQATVGLEILHQFPSSIDYLFIPIGGGGLAAGVSSIFRRLSPYTKIIGVEPAGAPAMKVAIEKGEVVKLDHIDTFADGAAVKKVGELTFEICRKNLDDIVLVPEGKICETMLQLYDEDALVVEPAGALTVAALSTYSHALKGKNVVCIVSGGNNDIRRTEEIRERALLYQGLKHYFIVNFPQRAGALKEFVNNVLGEHDDIVFFEYSKKNNAEKGPALVGIELKKAKDYDALVERMKTYNFYGQYLNEKPDLFRFII